MLRYQDLGVGKIINAWDTITVYGGSRMPAEVIDAMAEASRSFVDLYELAGKAGAKIAELTHNEAAYVTAGAACGLMLSAAACITGPDQDKINRLPDTAGLPNEIIIQKCQRVSWDRCVRQAGAKLVEIGATEQTRINDLEQAISRQTAAILYFAGSWYERHALPLDQVVQVASSHHVPVIVDAAANLPPVENLWRYTGIGADLVVFSGGKALCGPQNTGLILGRKDLIAACCRNGSPYSAIGRVAKVGKEEIMGVLTAVERYLSLDHTAILQQHEQWVAALIDSLAGLPHIEVSRVYPGPHGQAYPRMRVAFPDTDRRNEVVRMLRIGDPSILVGTWAPDETAIYVSPLTLNEDEVRIVAAALKSVISTIPHT